MEIIKRGIVFSNDIKRILSGINSLDYQYEVIPNDSIIKRVREDFENQTNDIFNNEVTIITEDEMLQINDLIGGEYPHCSIRQSIYKIG